MTETKQLKPLAEQVLLGEVATQCKIAELSATQLAKADGSLETWAAIQSILIAAANVSKILWPPKRENHARGEHLRALLRVDEANLLSDRTFRNHFEHYDERVESWFDESSSAAYTDLEINSIPPTPWSLPRPSHRKFNPRTLELTFREESVDLGAVLNALQDVKAKCRSFVLV